MRARRPACELNRIIASGLYLTEGCKTPDLSPGTINGTKTQKHHTTYSCGVETAVRIPFHPTTGALDVSSGTFLLLNDKWAKVKH